MSQFTLSLAHNPWVAIVIFLVTYFFIAVESGRGSHLDRTAAAFCGAVAMVLAGVVPLTEAYQAINWDTLIFLLGIMILVAHFQVSGFFDWIAVHVATFARTRFQLLVLLVFASGILSAFFVNDTICLIFTPIVLIVGSRLKIPPVPYVIAVATSANIGSVMSVTGNPQNAVIGVTANFSFLGFLAHLAPVTLIGLALNVAVISLFFRREILHRPLHTAVPELPVRVHKSLLIKCAVAALLVIVLWIMGYSFPLVAIAVGAFILVIGRVKAQNIYNRIDWEVSSLEADLSERDRMIQVKAQQGAEVEGEIQKVRSDAERQRQEMAAKVAQLNERIRDLNQKLLGTGASAAVPAGTPQAGFFKR